MTAPPPPPRRRRAARVILGLLALAAVLGAVFLGDLADLDTLARHRATLEAWRAAHPVLAPLAFILAYAAVVALSLPGATLATLTGGFLFGLFPGVLYNVAGATGGAVLLFLAVRAGLGDGVAARIARGGGAVARLQAGLQANPWSALLTMRLLPVVPFFVANVLPALAGVRLWPHAVTTFAGIFPGALVFTSVGAGLGAVLDRGETPDLGVIFSPPVLLPLLGLAALSAAPMVVRALRRDRGQA